MYDMHMRICLIDIWEGRGRGIIPCLGRPGHHLCSLHMQIEFAPHLERTTSATNTFLEWNQLRIEGMRRCGGRQWTSLHAIWAEVSRLLHSLQTRAPDHPFWWSTGMIGCWHKIRVKFWSARPGLLRGHHPQNRRIVQCFGKSYFHISPGVTGNWIENGKEKGQGGVGLTGGLTSASRWHSPVG